MRLLAPLAGLLLLASAGQAQGPLLFDSFDEGLGAWRNLADAEQAPTVQAVVAQDGQALESHYSLDGPNAVHVLGRPVDVPLTGARSLKFWLRTQTAALVLVALTERGGARWETLINSPAERWQRVELSFGRLRLSADTEDANGRLDPEQVEYLGVGDASRALPILPFDDGPRALWLDELMVDPFDAISAYSSDGELPYHLDTFITGFTSWLPMLGEVEQDAQRGLLTWRYEDEDDRIAGLLAVLGPLPAEGATHLVLTLRSERAAQLIVGLQEEAVGRLNRNESRYFALLDLPASDQPQTYTVALNQLQPDTGEGAEPDENGRLDLDQVSVLMIGDLAALTGEAEPNAIELDEVLLTGP